MPDEEAFLVVVGIDKPAGDAVGVVAADLAGAGVEHVHALYAHAKGAVLLLDLLNVGLARWMPVLGPQNDVVTHRLALPHKDVAAAIETVRASALAQPAVKLAFEFLVLTAARSGEVRLATWDEIDTTGRVWTISAERMKAKREHRVPLCSRALEVLDAGRALGNGNRLVFPMRSGRPISMSPRPRRRGSQDRPARSRPARTARTQPPSRPL